MPAPATCSECRAEMCGEGGEAKSHVILCRRHAAAEELVRALEEIAAATISTRIEDIARQALAGVRGVENG